MEALRQKALSALSGGERQKVYLAMVLAQDTPVILMDEPTTSLTDPEIERVFDMMRMLQKQNVAIVFISHKLKDASCTGGNIKWSSSAYRPPPAWPDSSGPPRRPA